MVVSHVLETGLDGRFERLESAAGNGLLTLHREANGSVHGNRITEIGVDHLMIEAPAPDLAIVGRAGMGVAALVAGFVAGFEDRAALAGGRAAFDVLEITDDLGVRVAGCTARTVRAGEWEVRTTLTARTAVLGPDGLPADEIAEGVSWPLERAP